MAKEVKNKTRKEKAREEAEKILRKDGTNFAFRSCWKCNQAHEHLKKCEIPLNCFGCGNWYFKGVCLSD